MDIVAVSFITAWIMIVLIFLAIPFFRGKVYWTLTLGLFMGWGIGDGYEETQTFTHKGYVTKHLVSAAPSHTQINGNIEGNFLFFAGVIQENRVYLLREEVEKGLYKDFEVKHEVYIREDSSLTNRGKFVQYYDCKDVTKSYEYFIWELYNKTENKCFYQKQEIIVPSGSVIKELNI
ncbi:TMhelix containing protein [Vibrio phage 1.063.O._10N.261.45.C7]|nr:TMhelix containing protein [Vibrio phage 1.063.O._10N.261.45.C7]